MIGNKEKKTGGPAFPGEFVRFESGEIGNNIAIREQGEGMSLRDYFAAAALTGIAGHLTGPKERAGETAAQTHARWSYSVADAMIAERAK